MERDYKKDKENRSRRNIERARGHEPPHALMPVTSWITGSTTD